MAPLQLYVDWVAAYGSVFVWYLGLPMPVVVLSDPEDWYMLLSGNNTQPLPKWSTMYAVLDAVSRILQTHALDRGNCHSSLQLLRLT